VTLVWGGLLRIKLMNNELKGILGKFLTSKLYIMEGGEG
jgi:hypothetical protein